MFNLLRDRHDYGVNQLNIGTYNFKAVCKKHTTFDAWHHTYQIDLTDGGEFDKQFNLTAAIPF